MKSNGRTTAYPSLGLIAATIPLLLTDFSAADAKTVTRRRREMEVVGSCYPSCLAASARRRGRGMDQDDEQVVGIPHDADPERVGTRGQIEWLAARRDERAAGLAEHCNRRVNVRDAQLDPCGARVLDPRKLRLTLNTLEVDQRELQT